MPPKKKRKLTLGRSSAKASSSKNERNNETAKNKWVRRKRDGDKIIGRMYNVSPSEIELFHLRILLLNIPGATSFDDLKTFEGVHYDTFVDVCKARSLIENDRQWEDILREASLTHMPHQLRILFSSLLQFCNVADPLSLWEVFKTDLSEDFNSTDTPLTAEQQALVHIQHLLPNNIKQYNLPDIPFHFEPQLTPQNIQSFENAERMRHMLTEEQQRLCDAVLSSVRESHNAASNDSRLYFVNGPGGSGKTFCYNYLINELSCWGLKVSSSATTGIASTLLLNGSTIHSTFKVPVPCNSSSTCRVKPNSKEADIIRENSLFILDETSMLSIDIFHCIDRLMRDIMNNNIPFGGKTFLFGGDFRQTLPVVRRGNSAEIVEQCILRSPLWSLFKIFLLSANQRVRENGGEFSQWLLKLGNDEHPKKDSAPFEGCIELPHQCIVDDIVSEIFQDELLQDNFVNRAILTPRNDVSLALNARILAKLPQQERIYSSYDSIESDEPQDAAVYSTEFVNSLTPSGMPQHRLTLKVGAIIMLLRNINRSQGLCNGTRLRVLKMYNNFIEAEIIMGFATGNKVFIPKMPISPSDTNLPFKLKRTQLPVRLSYAMTIEKSQGQSFDKVGIFLPEPVFSHGQLYVAFSRARSFDDIKISVLTGATQGTSKNKTYTRNVVYRQVVIV